MAIERSAVSVRRARWSARLLITLAVLCMALTLFGIRYWGFREVLAFESDTLLGIKLHVEPNLIPGSIYNHYFPYTMTLVDKVPGALAKYLRIDAFTIEVVYLLLLNVFATLAIFYLTYAISRDAFTGFLGIVLAMESQVQNLGKYLSLTIGYNPMVAYIALTVVIIILALYYDSRYRLAFLTAGLLFNIHPIHSVCAGFILLYYVVPRIGRLGRSTIVSSIMLYVLGTLPVIIYGLVIDQMVFGAIANSAKLPGELWWRMIQVRKATIVYPYLQGRWISFYDWLPTLSFVGILLGFLLIKGRHTEDARARVFLLPETREKTWAVVMGVGILCVIGVVFVSVVPMRMVASMALFRTTPYVVALACVYVAGLVRYLLSRDEWFPVFGAFFFIGIMMIYDSPTIVIFSSAILFYFLLEGRVSVMWLPGLAFIPMAQEAGKAILFSLGEWSGDPSRVWMPQKIAYIVIFVIVSGVQMMAGERGRRVSVLKRFSGKNWVGGQVLLVLVFFSIGLYGIRSCCPRLPEGGREWLEVQMWAHENTPKGTIFITPPQLSGFENFSERGQIISVLEVGLSIYSPFTFAEEVGRLRDFGLDIVTTSIRGKKGIESFIGDRYKRFSEGEFESLGKKYGAEYAVVEAGRSLRFEKVYENGRFTVLRL